MLIDFLGAALPWILIDLFIAISCARMSEKTDES